MVYRIKPLSDVNNKDLIRWGTPRQEPKGRLATDLLKSEGAVEKAAREKDIGKYAEELGYCRPPPEPREYEEFLTERGFDSPEDVPDTEKESLEAEYQVERVMGECFREHKPGYLDWRWEDWLWRDLGPFYDLWRKINENRNGYNIRRVWLCLAILGKDLQRPGGYTRKDIQRFADVESRGAARNIIRRLGELGVIEKREQPPKQPRYCFTGKVNDETADRIRNNWYIGHIRQMARWIEESLRGNDGTEEGWEWQAPDLYIVGDPKPPDWAFDAILALTRIRTKALKTCLDLPPEGRVTPSEWEPEELWSEIGKHVKDELRVLCDVSKEVSRDEWEAWDQALKESDIEPMILANLRDLIGERVKLPDDPSRTIDGFPEDPLLFKKH